MASERATRPAPAARLRALAHGRRVLLHLILIAAAIIMLYPILWMLVSTFKPQDQIFTDPTIWPRSFIGFKNYVTGWAGVDGHSFGRFFLNSFTISVGAVIGNVVAGSMTAYAFARLNFRFRRILFAVMLLTIMLPYHAVLIPQYVLFFHLGWVNTFLPIIVPKLLATDAFFIFLMVQFIRGIPRELDDAARVDGCSYIGIYWRILLPLMTPALVTTAIFTFIWTWDDFFSQLIYLSSSSKYTVTLALQAFLDATHESAWGAMFAMSILSLIPIFLIFVVFQRFLVEGIATTGLKR